MGLPVADGGIAVSRRCVVLGGLSPCCIIGRAGAEFAEITAKAGIDFQHRNGAPDEKQAPASTRSGLRFFDYDGDRDGVR